MLAGLLLLWQALVWLTGVPRYPAAAAAGGRPDAARRRRRCSLDHAAITLVEILLGLRGGVLIGGASALAMALLPPLQPWLLPLLVLGQTIPVFALAPLLVLWFGYGLASKVVMAILIIYFPVAAALFDGLRRTEPGWLDLARTMGAAPPAHAAAACACRPRCRRSARACASRPRSRRSAPWSASGSARRAGLGYLMLHANARLQIDADVRRADRADGDGARALRRGRPAAGAA